MSMTITINTIARVYLPAFDEEYRKALDAGHTKLGKTKVLVPGEVEGTTVPGESHLLKSISAAGKGRRGTISVKDKIHNIGSPDTSDYTVATTFYFPKGDPNAVGRLLSIAQGLFAAITADEGLLIQHMTLGAIELS